MRFKLGTLELDLEKGIDGTRVLYGKEVVLFPQRNLIETKAFLKEGFDFTRKHFNQALMRIDTKEFDEIYLFIALHHLYFYNINKQASLKISRKDLDHPQTADTVFDFFKKRHRKTWLQKSADFLGIDLIECQKKWEARERFMNK